MHIEKNISMHVTEAKVQEIKRKSVPLGFFFLTCPFLHKWTDTWENRKGKYQITWQKYSLTNISSVPTCLLCRDSEYMSPHSQQFIKDHSKGQGNFIFPKRNRTFISFLYVSCPFLSHCLYSASFFDATLHLKERPKLN